MVSVRGFCVEISRLRSRQQISTCYRFISTTDFPRLREDHIGMRSDRPMANKVVLGLMGFREPLFVRRRLFDHPSCLLAEQAI